MRPTDLVLMRLCIACICFTCHIEKITKELFLEHQLFYYFPRMPPKKMSEKMEKRCFHPKMYVNNNNGLLQSLSSLVS